MSGYFKIVVFIVIYFLAACTDSQKVPDDNTYSINELKEPLIKTNKYLTRTEKEDIDDFVQRYHWNMISTGTGLMYMIEDQGNAKKANYGNIVKAKYTLKLLNGDIVYNSENDGLLEFQVGKGGVPTGLEEGILLLGLHSKAKFILPSHLAFGLLGDSKRIPPRSVLIYDLEIIDLQ